MKGKILIIEDEEDIVKGLTINLKDEGYEVDWAPDGETGLRKSVEETPDLIILDIMLPEMDGLDVCRELRKKDIDIPILMLTAKNEEIDRVVGLEIGADDYITKPFDIQELRLRVRNALQRTAVGSISDPVTGLPKGAFVDERLIDCLESEGWAIMLISLENLDSFREGYGFVASDDVLRAVSLMVQNATHKVGSQSDFIGHLNSTDFVVITKPEVIANLKEHIRSRLEQTLEFFYPLRDRESIENRKNRLFVRMAELLPEHGPFGDLEHLKLMLLRLRR